MPIKRPLCHDNTFLSYFFLIKIKEYHYILLHNIIYSFLWWARSPQLLGVLGGGGEGLGRIELGEKGFYCVEAEINCSSEHGVGMNGIIWYQWPSAIKFMKEIPYFRRNFLKDIVLYRLLYITHIILYLLRSVIRTKSISLSSITIYKFLPILQPISINQYSLFFMW